MYDNMRRLHPRGAANRGICVDAEGAMLGPDCVLVRRSPGGFYTIDRDDASVLQKGLLDRDQDRDWLFRQCQRIADALNKGEIALAQIYGLYIPIGDLDDRQLQRIARAGVAETGFNPDEPRIPKGNPHGGEWSTEGGGAAAVPSESLLADTGADDSPDIAGNNDTGNSALPLLNTTLAVSTPPADPGGGGGRSGNEGVRADLADATLIADFSGGFHDVVVDTWIDVFQKNGIPAVKTLGIRLVGPSDSVIGYPDIIANVPGLGLAVIEVKTGGDPPLTPNQAGYLPILQLGGHIYSTDPRIAQLGLAPGAPFPPLQVIILYAPGPNKPYEVLRLPPPRFEH
jgi:hypothetical protein